MLDRDDIDRQIRVQREVIDSLKRLRSRILSAHEDISVAKTVGSSLSIGGTVAVFGGLLLSPFTAGLSLGLTAGGIAGGVVGAGTNVTTSIVETVKTKKWAKEIERSLWDLEREMKRVAEKIVKHPGWKQYVKQAAKGGGFVLKGTPKAIEIGKIIKYVTVMAPHYGIENIASFGFALKNFKGYCLLGIDDVLTSWTNGAVRIGPKLFVGLSVALGVVAVGFDIYNIVHTWANKPGAVKQIDEIVDKLETTNRKLNEIRDEF